MMEFNEELEINIFSSYIGYAFYRMTIMETIFSRATNKPVAVDKLMTGGYLIKSRGP